MKMTRKKFVKKLATKKQIENILFVIVLISFLFLVFIIESDPLGKNQKIEPTFYLIYFSLAYLGWIFTKSKIVLFIAFLTIILFRIILYYYADICVL
jgi:hypothetical protein